MSQLWHSVSLVSACEVLVVTCTIKILDHGSNPGPLLWDLGVLTTGTPGKSLIDLFYCLFSLSFIYFHTDFIISFISDSGLCLFLFFQLIQVYGQNVIRNFPSFHRWARIAVNSPLTFLVLFSKMASSFCMIVSGIQVICDFYLKLLTFFFRVPIYDLSVSHRARSFTHD